MVDCAVFEKRIAKYIKKDDDRKDDKVKMAASSPLYYCAN
jgi:hypothetical protein